ncbi:MAG: hypothetical protein ACK55I_27670, partial [bacterium]
ARDRGRWRGRRVRACACARSRRADRGRCARDRCSEGAARLVLRSLALRRRAARVVGALEGSAAARCRALAGRHGHATDRRDRGAGLDADSARHA